MNNESDKKQSSPCSCLNLRRASQSITELYNNYIAPSGLNIGQFSLLRYIRGLQPVNVSDLAEAIRLDRTTLVRNLKPLEEKGFVSDVSKKGTRNRQLKLTENGGKVLKEAELLWNDAQGFIEQSLGQNDLQLLTELLAKVEAMR
jgi:Transcriptional regulators